MKLKERKKKSERKEKEIKRGGGDDKISLFFNINKKRVLQRGIPVGSIAYKAKNRLPDFLKYCPIISPFGPLFQLIIIQ